MTGLRILIIEDLPEDAELIERELRSAGINFQSHRVWDRDQFLKALKEYKADIILSDFSLPQFDAIEALELLTNLNVDLPFILVTGSQGEEVAADCIKKGATDYILKSSLMRLPAAVTNALKKKHAETERERALKALKESEERYALAARGANDGLWDWNLASNRIYFSTRWKKMLGYDENEVGDSPEEWFDRIHADDVKIVRAAIDAHIAGRTPHFESEYRIRTRENTYRWMLARGLAVSLNGDGSSRMAGSQSDINDRKRAEEQLLHDAFHDALTGLPNRALFFDRLQRSVQRAKRHKEYLFAVLFLDLDRFKTINDSLGHMAGDQLLIAIAENLNKMLRPGDTVSRLGGDEFVILTDDLENTGEATRIANRILQSFVQPYSVRDHEVFTTCSIGIAMSLTHYERAEDLLRDADTALYRAKALGKARYAIFDPAMHEQALQTLQLENDLRRAIERQEFKIHYQPIISLHTGKIEGFESLLRWDAPGRGMVYPADFIPLAEETGLIQSLGMWAIEQSCAQAFQWRSLFRDRMDLSMSVNLSCKQFSQPDLIDQIEHTLMVSHLDPHHLRFEITESMIMEDPDSAVHMLLRLKKLNVKLHLDDFGTGYSSLSYLHRFPFDSLKIDRSFVSKMHNDEESLEIVRTIIMLGRNLQKSVIAEGVETAEQLAQLRALECHQAQGYFFSHALEHEKAEELLLRDPHW